MVGTTISHYKVLSEVGRGGMGVVYKAEDTKLRRTVALKFLRADAIEDAEAKERFLREAQAAAGLDHPNICTVDEIDEAEGETFLAMAYVEGRTVKDKISDRPLKLDEVIDIATQTAEGLKAAHNRGVVHRDIKPANLMLTEEGQVKIMDFGLAQLAEQSRLTKTATILGTPAYMSPEQTRRKPTDRRTDVWSLGVVIYEMVTGRLPFAGERQEAVLYAIGNEDPEPITALRAGLPIELDFMVGKALAKGAADRYQHVEEMIVDLRALERRTESGSAKPSGRPVTAASWEAPARARRRRLAWVAAAAVVVLMIAGAAFWNFRPTTTEAPQEPMRVVPLTTYPGSEAEPSFSPDGAQVAFSWDGENQDNFDIYVKEIESDTRRRLTSNPAVDSHPAWSPDGRFIAFLRGAVAEAGGRAGVMLIPAIGGHEREIAQIDPWRKLWKYFPIGALAWSLDSKSLILTDLSSRDEAGALYVLSTETGEKRQLTWPPAGSIGDMSPAISPDGRNLTFVRSLRYGDSEVYHLPLGEDLTAQTEPRRLTSVGSATSSAWTADGRRLVFTSGFLPASRLWQISMPDTREPKAFAAVGATASSPTISWRGKRLAYSRSTYDTNIWELRVGGPLGAIGSPSPRLSSTRDDTSPQYSPDGSRIVFESDRTGTSGIWLSDADGSNAKPLFLQPNGGAGTPRWSPDGQRIVFDSYPEGHGDIYAINTAGGEPFRLTAHPGNDYMPSWSHDGQWVYFASTRSGRDEIWKVPAAGGDPVQVTRHGGFTAFESHDGEFLYYTKAHVWLNSIWKVPVDGGDEAQLLELVFERNFALTPQGIYFIQVSNPLEPESAYQIRFFEL